VPGLGCIVITPHCTTCFESFKSIIALFSSVTKQVDGYVTPAPIPYLCPQERPASLFFLELNLLAIQVKVEVELSGQGKPRDPGMGTCRVPHSYPSITLIRATGIVGIGGLL
jgi:hypothetical protein